MRSVLFFSEQLDGGGAEQILKNTLLKIDREKFDVTTVTQEYCEDSPIEHKYFFRKSDNPLKKIINKMIVKFSLTAPETLVKKVFIHKNFDVEIAFCEGNSTRLIGNAKSSPSTKKIAWVHTDMVNNPWSESVFGGAKEEKKCYEKFDAVVCVSQTMKDSFIKKYGMADKVHLIYNVLDFDSVLQQSKEPAEVNRNGEIAFVMVGRLAEVKGLDRMLDAVLKLKNDGYVFSVNLVGSGDEEEKIRKFISDNELESFVTLLGFQKNPHKFVSKCDAYVCSSYAEGYSTTATEAIVLGVPVITTDVSGMREIFGDKECGIICENSTDGLYSTLKTVLDNPELLKKYSANASERAKEFDAKKRIAAVEDFIDSI